MEFSRLRLLGFKSFVEPSEFVIEPGTNGAPDTVRVIEGTKAFPSAGFSR